MLVIADYEPRYQNAFKQLNEEWIKKFFTMEEGDYKALDDPQRNILDGGGHICIALLDDEPVGACALIKVPDTLKTYELVKMAVAPKVQGRGVGWELGKAILGKAKALGASRIYLESNTSLAPAIALYRKLGFTEVTGRNSPYSRCDIQMELLL